MNDFRQLNCTDVTLLVEDLMQCFRAYHKQAVSQFANDTIQFEYQTTMDLNNVEFYLYENEFDATAQVHFLVPLPALKSITEPHLCHLLVVYHLEQQKVIHTSTELVMPEGLKQLYPFLSSIKVRDCKINVARFWNGAMALAW